MVFTSSSRNSSDLTPVSVAKIGRIFVVEDLAAVGPIHRQPHRHCLGQPLGAGNEAEAVLRRIDHLLRGLEQIVPAVGRLQPRIGEVRRRCR